MIETAETVAGWAVAVGVILAALSAVLVLTGAVTPPSLRDQDTEHRRPGP
jgi:hypothetical protein